RQAGPRFKRAQRATLGRDLGKSGSRWAAALAWSNRREGLVKIEHVEQIADRRRVAWNVRVRARDRVRQIVAAPRGESVQPPVTLYEFQNRNMVGVGMNHLAVLRVVRNHDKRNAGAIAK